MLRSIPSRLGPDPADAVVQAGVLGEQELQQFFGAQWGQVLGGGLGPVLARVVGHAPNAPMAVVAIRIPQAVLHVPDQGD